MNAQAGLRLCCSQTTEDRFFRVDAHIIYVFLFQLDSGSSEKISLMSRDEQNILVVSYAEIKQCVENAFGDIISAANQSAIS